MVDLGQTRIAHRVHDAARIALRANGVAGVDQDGFARGRDKQRPVAAFDVGDIDVERRALLGRGRRHGQHQSGSDSRRCAHGYSFLKSSAVLA